jgi:hypothetical protein
MVPAGGRMGDMYGAPPVTIRPQLPQLVPQLAVGVVTLAVGAVLQDRALVVIALFGIGYLVMVWRQHGTHLNDHELVLLGLRNRTIPWAAVAEIREHSVFGGRGLLVEETSGRRTPLTAPRHSRLLPDRDYARRRDQVLAAWQESQDERWRAGSRPLDG